MKKTIILPLILFTTFLYGQLSPGLKAGVNISNFTGGDFSQVEKSAYVGFHAGGLLHIRFGHLVLQPELLFSSQGAKLEALGVESIIRFTMSTFPSCCNGNRMVVFIWKLARR